MRHPLGRCTRRSLLQHAINLLEGKTLGLGDEEVGEGEGNEAQRTPHEVDLGAEIRVAFGGTDEVWGDDTDDL